MSIVTVHLTFSNLWPNALLSAKELCTIVHVPVSAVVMWDFS